MIEDMTPHPEGGRYKEIFRSKTQININPNRSRCALTHIYFSLSLGEKSLFHKVKSDEIWNLYHGDGLILITWDGKKEVIRTELSLKSKNFCHVVPANVWQAAYPIGSEVLVGCSVAPGFDFEDFMLLRNELPLSESLLHIDPGLKAFI